MSDSFRIRDLAAGDVLLYRAADGIGNLVSAMIRKLDGTEVSHAGLALGDGMVAEAREALESQLGGRLRSS